MKNTVFTVVSFDGWQYVFTETPDYHTTYEKAFEEFQSAMLLGQDEEDAFEVAIVAYPSPTHLNDDKCGEVVACTPNWHEVSGRWV